MSGAWIRTSPRGRRGSAVTMARARTWSTGAAIAGLP
jgi:hypothetical protein